MKHSDFKIFALSLIAALAILSCSNEPKIKTVLSPTVAECSDSLLTVDKVILTDSMTIIDFSYKCNEIFGSSLFTPRSVYIVANGKKYVVIGSKNIPLSDTKVQSETIYYRTTTHSLIFPPIPFDTDSISFYEYDPKDGGGWYVKGIDLTGKSCTIAYKTKKDSEAYISKIEGSDTNSSSDDFDYSEPEIPSAPEPEATYNYYCPLCDHLIQATKSHEPRPNSGQCTNGYHQWRCYGKVGNYLYECSHCGLQVYAQDRPNTDGCNASSSNSHMWQRVN